MAFADNVAAGVVAIRNKLNLMTPRLIPAGGVTGQVLAKASPTNNDVTWITPATGGGTGGTGTTGRYRGPFGSNYYAASYTFENGAPNSDWSFSKPGQVVDSIDASGGTTKALSLPTVATNFGNEWMTFHCRSNSAFNQLTLRYKVETEAGYDFFKIYVDGTAVVTESGINPYKTQVIMLAPGDHTIKLEVTTDANDVAGFNNVHLARVTMPLEAASEPYAYSDTVIYDGSMWFCIAPGTTQTPGAGNDWQHFDVIGSTSPTTPTTPTSSALAYMTAALSADVAMANANAFYTGATVTLPSAGVWMITGQIGLARAATTLVSYTGKVTLDTTVVSSSIMSFPSQNPHYVTMPLSGIVTATAANQVLTLSGAASVAGCVLKATPGINGTGLTKLTQVVAVKIA